MNKEQRIRKIIREEVIKILESTRDFYYIRTSKGWIADVKGEPRVVSYRDKGTGFNSRGEAEQYVERHDLDVKYIKRVSSKDISLPGLF